MLLFCSLGKCAVLCFFFPGCANCIRPANPCVRELPLFACLFVLSVESFRPILAFFMLCFTAQRTLGIYTLDARCVREEKISKAFLPNKKITNTEPRRMLCLAFSTHKRTFFPCIAMLLHASVEKKLNRVTIVLPPNETIENKMC